ncbi:MAG: hypothetical protein ACTHJ3_04420 [Pararhizobium sp.]
MSRSKSRWAVAATALAGLLVVLATDPAAAAARTSRDEMCRKLNIELQHSLSTTRAKTRRTVEARALQKKALHLCTVGKKAQGIRTYAEALKLVGNKPTEH